MRHIITVVLTIIILAACQENNTLTSPNEIDNTKLTKTVVASDKQDACTADFVVDGIEGGKFKMFYKWKTGENKGKSVKVELLFPNNSFSGEIVLSADFNPTDLSIAFTDPGVTILKPALLTVEFKGIDGNSWNSQTFDFNYINDSGQTVEYSRIDLDVTGGIALVEKAQLWIPLGKPSRYGFLR